MTVDHVKWLKENFIENDTSKNKINQVLKNMVKIKLMEGIEKNFPDLSELHEQNKYHLCKTIVNS